LVLASASPRRRELLESSGFEILCRPAEVEELSEGLAPRNLVLANAELKALEVASSLNGDLVLGADTIVVLDGEILGKPRNLSHAAEMLGRLAGRMHEVLTGVCLTKAGTATRCRFVESSRVYFKPLDKDLIDRYLNEINPLDKAGSYAAQEDYGRLIDRIEGSLDNVIGLPVAQVITAIETYLNEIEALEKLPGI